MSTLLPWMTENPWLTFFLALLIVELAAKLAYYLAKCVQYARGVPDAPKCACASREDDDSDEE